MNHAQEFTDDFDESPHARRGGFRRKLKIFTLLVLLAVLAIAGFVGWRFYEDAATLTGNKDPLQLLSLFIPAHLHETNGRVNILLAGYSADDPGHQGAQLTDSIMIVSVDPQTKHAVLISIPRDTWVNIPGFGYQKINAAYEDGQEEGFSAPGYPTGGMGLLEMVVNQDFGIKSDYDGLLDYAAFRGAVNAVGGVTVNIQSPDPRGLYDPNTNLRLSNGSVTLNGQQALDLARARGDGPGSYGFPAGDFDRTMYQQTLLIAIKNNVSKTSFISNPFRVVSLTNAIGDNFRTDMSLSVMNTLYRDAKGINNTNIKPVTLNNVNGQDLLVGYTTYGGEDALIPAAGFNNFTQIQNTLQDILNTN